MWSKSLTGAEIVLASGALGTAILIVAPYPLMVIFGPVALLVVWSLGKPWFFDQKLRTRLTIEFVVFGLVLAWSSFSGMARFDRDQARRCQILARQARAGARSQPKSRPFLESEADWLERKARDLRNRGLWIGLLRGPRIEEPAEVDYVHEFGTLESIESHEKRIREALDGP